jgi:hypothetical protein
LPNINGGCTSSDDGQGEEEALKLGDTDADVATARIEEDAEGDGDGNGVGDGGSDCIYKKDGDGVCDGIAPNARRFPSPLPAYTRPLFPMATPPTAPAGLPPAADNHTVAPVRAFTHVTIPVLTSTT